MITRSRSVTAVTAGLLVLLGLADASCSSTNSDSPVTPVPPVQDQLQSVLDSAVASGLPGIALAIRGDNLDYTGAAGVTDRMSMEPLTENNRFYLASIGKTYLAVATIKAASEGLLSLDDSIASWLPVDISSRIASSDSITVRHLLNHTAGIFDFQNDGEVWDETFLADQNRQWTNSDALPFFLDRPLHFQPSTDYRYSNSNYVVAALVLEQATGLPIASVIRNYIIEPLGLQNTVHGNEASGLADFVHGYVRLEDELIDVYPWYLTYGIADGGIQASASDLAEFVRAVITTDSILDDTMRTRFLSPSEVGNPPSDYALGITVVAGATPDYFVYSHSGKDPGTQSEFIHVSSEQNQVTIALVASASFHQFDEVFQNALESVLQVLSGSE